MQLWRFMQRRIEPSIREKKGAARSRFTAPRVERGPREAGGGGKGRGIENKDGTGAEFVISIPRSLTNNGSRARLP